MLKRVKTATLQGMEGVAVDIETDIGRGLPYFSVVGLADASVKEAGERVKRAMLNSGLEYPKGHITVNLSPAYIPKKGSHYDLGIAVGIWASMEASQGRHCRLESRAFIGELSLDGSLLPSRGVLPMLMPLVSQGSGQVEEIILPLANCKESWLVMGQGQGQSQGQDADKGKRPRLIPAKSLGEVIGHLQGKTLPAYEGGEETRDSFGGEDFGQVKGQQQAKEAIVTALAGGHNLLFIGPPGTGKTMLAKRIIGVLPPMTEREKLEATQVYSYAGLLTEDMPLIDRRPFRHVTSSITTASLIGGGASPMPGEVSLAHKGVLFLDEMLEVKRSTLEALRTPIEEKRVRIIRRDKHITFPADFLLVGASNPCRCGYLGDDLHQCTCTPGEVLAYRSKLSGPLADRIDICVEINRVNYGELQERESMDSQHMREIIERAKEIQRDRFKGYSFDTNSQIEDKFVEEFCTLDREGMAFMEQAYVKCGISPRRYYKMLKLARTVADMKEAKDISLAHLATAFHYTRFLSEGGEIK